MAECDVCPKKAHVRWFVTINGKKKIFCTLCKAHEKELEKAAVTDKVVVDGNVLKERKKRCTTKKRTPSTPSPA